MNEDHGVACVLEVATWADTNESCHAANGSRLDVPWA